MPRATEPPPSGFRRSRCGCSPSAPGSRARTTLACCARSRPRRRARSRPIHLTIVGRRAGFDELDAEIDRLAAEAGAVLYGHVSDDELHGLHAAAAATVFGSWEEGFGLPVLESLWHGRPCLCHTGSAMAELVPGGGMLAVDMLDEDAHRGRRCVRLADEPDLLARLGRRGGGAPDPHLGRLRRGRPARALPRRLRARLAAAGVCARRAGRCSPARSRPTTARPGSRHSLPRLLEATRPWRDVVEVVVCDNASTDDTPEVVARFRGEPNFTAHRNPDERRHARQPRRHRAARPAAPSSGCSATTTS